MDLKERGRRQREAVSGSPVAGDKESSRGRRECDFDLLHSPSWAFIMVPWILEATQLQRGLQHRSPGWG